MADATTGRRKGLWQVADIIRLDRNLCATRPRHSCVTAHSHRIAWYEWRVVVELISLVMVHGTQVVLVDCRADCPS